MKHTPLFMLVILCCTFYAAPVVAEYEDESCYAQGDKTISLAMSLKHTGVFGAFDIAVHDLVSVGGAFGFNRYEVYTGWQYWQYPLLGRVAFHPLNLGFLAENLKIRDNIDLYAGVTAGFVLINSHWNGVTSQVGQPEKTGVRISELLGLRVKLNDRFSLFAEDCGEAGHFALGLRLSL